MHHECIETKMPSNKNILFCFLYVCMSSERPLFGLAHFFASLPSMSKCMQYFGTMFTIKRLHAYMDCLVLLPFFFALFIIISCFCLCCRHRCCYFSDVLFGFYNWSCNRHKTRTKSRVLASALNAECRRNVQATEPTTLHECCIEQ